MGANLIDVWATYWLKEWENDPLPDVDASKIDPRVVLTHEPERGRVAVYGQTTNVIRSLDFVLLCAPDDEVIKEIFISIDDSYEIAVKTEIKRNIDSIKLFNTLGMKNDSYFNAGVMAINLKKWKINETEKISQERISTMAEKLQFWDQVILNSIFDGNYFELHNDMNHLIDLSINPDSLSTAAVEREKLPIFLHYAGSNKPWFFKGILSDDSKFYQKVYKSLFSSDYHLVASWKKLLLIQLIDYIKNMSSYNIENRFSLIYTAVKRIVFN